MSAKSGAMIRAISILSSILLLAVPAKALELKTCDEANIEIGRAHV